MRKAPFISTIVAGGLLAACSTPTPYVEASGPEDEGYRTSQVEQDTYRVVFDGNEATSRQTVETYLLYRAAQVAENTLHEYFAVQSRDTQASVDVDTYTSYSPYTSAPGFYGYSLGYGYNYPYYTASPYRTGYRGFASPDPTYEIEDSYQAVAFIEVYEERPRGVDNLYEAARVIDQLGAEIEQSQQRSAAMR